MGEFLPAACVGNEAQKALIPGVDGYSGGMACGKVAKVVNRTCLHVAFCLMVSSTMPVSPITSGRNQFQLSDALARRPSSLIVY